MFRRRNRAQQDELIYLSRSKLLGLSQSRGVKTSHLRVDASGEASIGLPMPLEETGARASVSVDRVDEFRALHEAERDLRRLLSVMGADTRPDLDAPSPRLAVGEWFRFHRLLRLGVGTADSQQDISAVIMIDRAPLALRGGIAGLLLHGSPQHLLPPYRFPEYDDPSKGRSGSGTHALFMWLRRMVGQLDTSPDRDLAEIDDDEVERRPREIDYAAEDLYDVFTRDDGLIRFPEVSNLVPCEDFARVTHIAPIDAGTIIMASPLYVRVRPLAAVSRG